MVIVNITTLKNRVIRSSTAAEESSAAQDPMPEKEAISLSEFRDLIGDLNTAVETKLLHSDPESINRRTGLELDLNEDVFQRLDSFFDRLSVPRESDLSETDDFGVLHEMSEPSMFLTFCNDSKTVLFIRQGDGDKLVLDLDRRKAELLKR